MSATTDPVLLTERLIGFDTVNPPGGERAPAEYLAETLRSAGFHVTLIPFGDGRANLVARIGAQGGPTLCFTGHLDTVPLGSQPWSVDPYGTIRQNGRIYGRGSSDMKSGVAAFVSAAIDTAQEVSASKAAMSLVITAGEETGCEGARELVHSHADTVGRVDALVIAEPTENLPLLGHKGVLWLRAITTGKTAHGSMPHLGDNAVHKAARIIDRLSKLQLGSVGHPVMGEITLNIGTCHGGTNINSVPDHAEIEIDLRTPPDANHEELIARIRSEAGQDLSGLEILLSLSGIWTDPEDRWIAQVFSIVADVTGEKPQAAAAPYFTDGSALVPALGNPPAVVLGPGEASMAHQTDEYCEVHRIREAALIYGNLIRNWTGRAPPQRNASTP